MMSRTNLPASLYIASLPVEIRPIATEAVFECLKLGYPINRLEITAMARELQSRKKVNG